MEALCMQHEIKSTTLYYRVTYKGKIIIDNSPLSLIFKEVSFSNNVKITAGIISSGVESYSLVVGKAKDVKDEFRQLVITIQQTGSPFLSFNIVIRAFNDGLAFRYELPQWQHHSSFTLLQENTSFNITGNPVTRTLLFDNFTSSHEGVYQKIPACRSAHQNNARPSGIV